MGAPGGARPTSQGHSKTRSEVTRPVTTRTGPPGPRGPRRTDPPGTGVSNAGSITTGRRPTRRVGSTSTTPCPPQRVRSLGDPGPSTPPLLSQVRPVGVRRRWCLWSGHCRFLRRVGVHGGCPRRFRCVGRGCRCGGWSWRDRTRGSRRVDASHSQGVWVEVGVPFRRGSVVEGRGVGPGRCIGPGVPVVVEGKGVLTGVGWTGGSGRVEGSRRREDWWGWGGVGEGRGPVRGVNQVPNVRTNSGPLFTGPPVPRVRRCFYPTSPRRVSGAHDPCTPSRTPRP